MLRRIGFGVLFGCAGYIGGAVGGGFIVNALSSNQFDRDMEAVMTGAFVTGPLAALVAFGIGAWWAGRPRTAPLPAAESQ